jgi:hypothetical protein
MEITSIDLENDGLGKTSGVRDELNLRQLTLLGVAFFYAISFITLRIKHNK